MSKLTFVIRVYIYSYVPLYLASRYMPLYLHSMNLRLIQSYIIITVPLSAFKVIYLALIWQFLPFSCEIIILGPCHKIVIFCMQRRKFNYVEHKLIFNKLELIHFLLHREIVCFFRFFDSVSSNLHILSQL